MYEHPQHLSRYDFQALEARMNRRFDELKEAIIGRLERRQATYTIKQFSELTGLKYDTVLARCRRGKLKARQEGAGTSWTIDGSEVDRYLKEANENEW